MARRQERRQERAIEAERFVMHVVVLEMMKVPIAVVEIQVKMVLDHGVVVHVETEMQVVEVVDHVVVIHALDAKLMVVNVDNKNNIKWWSRSLDSTAIITTTTIFNLIFLFIIKQ